MHVWGIHLYLCLLSQLTVSGIWLDKAEGLGSYLDAMLRGIVGRDPVLVGDWEFDAVI